MPIIPAFIRQELEAVELITALRLAKLIAMHPAAEVELPKLSNGELLSLGAPRIDRNTRPLNLRSSSSISNEDSSSNLTLFDRSEESNDAEELKRRHETLSSCVGRIANIPAAVVSLLTDLGKSIPLSMEGPLNLAVSIILHLYCSTNAHVSRAASHAFGVVARHEAARRRAELLCKGGENGGEEEIGGAGVSSNVMTIPLTDVFHPSIISANVTDAFAPLALTNCRSIAHLQVTAHLHPAHSHKLHAIKY